MNFTQVVYKESITKDAISLKEALEQFRNKLEFGVADCDTEELKEKMEAKIQAKLEAGKRLSNKEMQYLRRNNPVLCAMAMRVEMKRKSVETRLEHASSKQEVEDIRTETLSTVSKNDPAKKYIIAAVEKVVEEFKGTDAYKKLPETEKEAEKKGRWQMSGTKVSYETGENSYQMAFAEEMDFGFTAIS